VVAYSEEITELTRRNQPQILRYAQDDIALGQGMRGGHSTAVGWWAMRNELDHEQLAHPPKLPLWRLFNRDGIPMAATQPLLLYRVRIRDHILSITREKRT
jgi:hypothetical protein